MLGEPEALQIERGDVGELRGDQRVRGAFGFGRLHGGERSREVAARTEGEVNAHPFLCAVLQRLEADIDPERRVDECVLLYVEAELTEAEGEAE